MALNGIDPAVLLGGGKGMLPPEARKKLDKESGLEKIGIDFKLMVKIDVNAKGFFELVFCFCKNHF